MMAFAGCYIGLEALEALYIFCFGQIALPFAMPFEWLHILCLSTPKSFCVRWTQMAWCYDIALLFLMVDNQRMRVYAYRGVGHVNISVNACLFIASVIARVITKIAHCTTTKRYIGLLMLVRS